MASAEKSLYNDEKILIHNNKSREITIGFFNTSVIIPFLKLKRKSENIKMLNERYLIDKTMSEIWILIINGSIKINTAIIIVETFFIINLLNRLYITLWVFSVYGNTTVKIKQLKALQWDILIKY